MTFRDRTKSANNANTSPRSVPRSPNAGTNLAQSTDIVCRALRSYRKKLSTCAENLDSAIIRELDRELKLTARAVGEKAIKSKGVDEAVMVKLLDQYSERMLEVLDQKIEASIAAKKNGSSLGEEVGISAGAWAEKEKEKGRDASGGLRTPEG